MSQNNTDEIKIGDYVVVVSSFLGPAIKGRVYHVLSAADLASCGSMWTKVAKIELTDLEKIMHESLKIELKP